MAKFILVKDYTQFDEIKNYIKNNRKNSYYIASKLMYDYLSSLKYRFVTGLNMYDIKVREHDKIDLLAMPVYNRVFQTDTFRIDAIKDYYLKELNHEKEYDSVVFGIEEDLSDFRLFDVEQL